MDNQFDSRSAERRMELIFEHSSGMLFVITPDFKVLRANKKLLSALGLTAEAVAGRYCYEVSRRRDTPCEACVLRTVMQTNHPACEEQAVPLPDGSLRWFEISGYPLRDENGAIIELVEMATDINERKKTELALRESEEKYRRIFENIIDVYYEATLAGEFLEVSPSVEKFLKYPRGQVIGKRVTDFYAHPEEREAFLAQLQANGEVTDYPIMLNDADGALVAAAVSAKLMFDSAGKPLKIIGSLRDMTRQRSAEAALRDSEGLFRALAASTASAIMVHQDGKFVYANPAAQRILGYSQEELLLMNFWESVHPNFQKLVRERGEARQRGEAVPERYEIQVVRKDGASIWMDISSGAMTWKGRPAVITSFFEITARKALEERLRTLSAAVEQSANTIVITDTDGNIQYVNPKFTELTGYTAAEAQGLNPRILNARTQPAALYEDLWRAIAAGRVWRGEFQNKKKSGELYWEQATISPLWDGEKITHYLAVKEDITARKNAEQALLASEEKFRRLVESSPDVVVHISLEGTILYVSPAKGAFRGYTPAEVIGTNVADYIAREEDMERAFAEIQKIIETGQSGRFEFLAKAKEGEPFEVENHYAPLMEDGRVASLLLVMRDVSERKRVEKELARACKLESVGILAGGIAHDFNNIMTGIFGNLQLAKLKLAGDHPAHKYIFRAWEATERATGLTNQLLTFAKGGEPILEAVGVKEVIQKIVSFNLTGSSVKASLSFSEGLWPLKADSGQFGQLVANLVINARQAMPDGGVLQIAAENVERPDPVETPGLAASGPFVKLTLTDDGVGIAPDHLPLIFDPYFTTKQTGSGLGLATVYSIVKSHNGHIGIASEVGRGTTFTIHLPADFSGQTRNAASTEEPDGASLGGGRALIMDDEEMVREVMGGMLEALGYHADFAGDGREAVAKYREAQDGGDPYALVVMDLTIPGGMGGRETVKIILDINPEAKVIVASGYSHDPVMAHFEEYGFRGRIVKPINIDAMKGELARIMK